MLTFVGLRIRPTVPHLTIGVSRLQFRELFESGPFQSAKDYEATSVDHK